MRVFVLKFRGVVWIVYSIEISIKDILSTATIYTASFDTLDVKNRVDQYSLSQPEESHTDSESTPVFVVRGHASIL